jgi:hypothetical protein
LEIAMLNDPQIQAMLKQIAAGVLPSVELLEIRTEPSVDMEGRDALRITLVLTEEAAKLFSGDEASRLLMDLHDGLLLQGDERFPVIYYATPADLNNNSEDEELSD